MTQGALIWFVVTLLPNDTYEAKPQQSATACRTVAEAYQRINEQLGSGKRTFCVRTSVHDLAAQHGRLANLR